MIIFIGRTLRTRYSRHRYFSSHSNLFAVLREFSVADLDAVSFRFLNMV